MKRSPKTWLRMAEIAEREADKAASSDAPWALQNLRDYQNLMSKWLGEYYKALCEKPIS